MNSAFSMTSIARSDWARSSSSRLLRSMSTAARKSRDVSIAFPRSR